jgi:PAS domain S-box-containing protein
MEFHPLKNKTGKIIGAGVGVFETTEINSAHERLRQSEELFKTLVQNSTDAFQLADIDFELQYISETVENVLGYKPSDLIRKNGLDNVHPDERDRVRDWFKSLRTQPDKLVSIEYRVKNKEGKWIWIENFGRNMLGNSRVNAIVMNFRNIQSKKMADYTLVQAEQRLSLLLNNTEESFIILNSRLRIVAYNRAAQEHSPYFFTQELQSGLSILDLVNPEEMDRVIQLFEKVFDGDQMERETTFVDEKKEQHIYSHIYRPLFDKDNDIFGVFITSADITKRKLAEHQVKESEIRFKTIIQESFDAVLITDASAKVIYSSPSISNVLGYKAEDLIDKKGFDFIHPDFLTAAKAKFSEVLANPHSEKNIDIKMLNAKQEYSWVEVKAKNMFDNRYVEGVLISLRDITSRKNAEEFISLSEQRFKGLVQSGADLISILDENGIIQYTSPSIKTIIGIEPDLHKGSEFLKYVHPEDYEWVKEKFDGLLVTKRKQIHVGPYRYRNDAEQYYWLESTITNLLGDASIKGIVLNSRDVTIRKKLTEDLAANTERLKSAQKIAKLGYFEYDFKHQSIFCSDEVFEILQIEKKIFSDLDFSVIENIVHPEDRIVVRTDIENAVRGEKDLNIECRLKTNDGSEKVVLAMGGVVQDKAGAKEKFSVTLQDITDSKMALLALQTMEGRFKSLFENSIDGVLITLPSGEIISGNPAVCKMLGYEEDEITEFKRSDILDIESASVKQMMEERNRSGVFLGEISMKHKDGHIIPTEITSINMKDAQGNTYHSNIIRDITEKKKIEEEQQSLTQELIKNNQDLQQFSFITSHNLRAPVANLISILNLYDKKKPEDEFNQLLIEKFEEATLQLNSTLNDLINVLVIKSNTNVEKQDLNLDNVLSEVRKGIDNLLQVNKGVITADFSEVEIVKYNRIHLESIFLNLLTNAIRYRSSERKPVIHIRSYREGKWVVVSFTDNGLGIDLKRYGDRLFGLYQRFHESKEGKGLGLYMVNSQVVTMGGKIEVESEPGKGSTFKVYFKS